MSKSGWFWGYTVINKGGPTSGNYGHKGRPGIKGGSMPGGGHGAIGAAYNEDTLAVIAEYREGKRIAKEAGFKSATAPTSASMEDENKIANDYLNRAAPTTGNWKVATNGERGAIKHKLVTALADRAGIDYQLSNKLIRQWSYSSNDSDSRSLSLQEACSEEFKIPLSDWQKERIADNPGEGLAPRSVERKFLRAMYDHTQEELAKQGLQSGDTVRMYRGMKSEYGQAGGEYLMKQNAMSSWSVGISTARDFALGGGGSIFAADVPVKNVLCSCLTGFGCFGEGEFVTLGVPASIGRMLSVGGVKA